MDKKKLRKALSEVLQHVDYDIWKDQFNVETAEYGTDAEANMDELVSIFEDEMEKEED